jgi:hypothetical protein
MFVCFVHNLSVLGLIFGKILRRNLFNVRIANSCHRVGRRASKVQVNIALLNYALRRLLNDFYIVMVLL